MPRTPGLGVWLNNEKVKYRNKKIPIERVLLMEGLGLNWTATDKPLSWEEAIEQFQNFKKTMKHCNIFMDAKSPSPLAKWAWAQRLEYKRFRKQADSLLTAEKIEQLDEIGFKWKAPTRK